MSSKSPVPACETWQMRFAAFDSLEPAQIGLRGSPILNLAWARREQVPYNKPRERTGMNLWRDSDRGSAGRSAPGRWADQSRGATP